MATALDNGAQAIRKDSEMTNPFKPHANALFADRGSIDHALAYAADVVNGLSSTDKAAAWTALMVLVNTAAKLWPETPAPESEDAAQVRAALAARAADALPLDQLVAHQLGERIADLDARIETLTDRVNAMTERTTEDALDSAIENWCDTYLDDRMESWASDNLDLDDRVETWMENNLDIENEVRKTLRGASFSVEF